jgi:TolB protein
MVNPSRRSLVLGAAATLALRPFAAAAQSPLRIRITDGVIEPLPIAIPAFVAEGSGSEHLARDTALVVTQNLVNSGLFREIPPSAHIGRITNIDAPVQFADWRAVNAQALLVGAARASGNQVAVRFRLWDVAAQQQIGEGLQFDGPREAWRRMGHKVADAVYSRLTGEGGYFDSRVAFIAESGPKNARRKQLAVMDQDGANVRMLTDGSSLVLAPRISRTAGQILYTSYQGGVPRVVLMDAASGQRRALDSIRGMAFAPRFAPDGRRAVYSASEGGVTNIFEIDLGSGSTRRLTQSATIDTAPSYSPDGSQIVFESDRAGTQQLYVMNAGGGEARRISFGEGRYATPVWSPRGDLVAFTKMVGGRFHIGVMRLDGSGERLLTASYLDEGPTWAPNGRVIMFYRETPGDAGGPRLHSVDVTGRNLRPIPTQGFASDPSWSGLLG